MASPQKYEDVAQVLDDAMYSSFVKGVDPLFVRKIAPAVATKVGQVIKRIIFD